MDAQTIDLERYQYTQANITTFRIFDRELMFQEFENIDNALEKQKNECIKNNDCTQEENEGIKNLDGTKLLKLQCFLFLFYVKMQFFL